MTLKLPKEDRTEIPYVVPITYRNLKKNYKSLAQVPLSDKAKALGQIFQKISVGEMQPNGVGGVLMDGDMCMAFRGTGDQDMSTVYHFLVIPKNFDHQKKIILTDYLLIPRMKLCFVLIKHNQCS